MKLLPKSIRRRSERFLAEEVGRLIYGNLLGPENNRVARRRLEEARRHAAPAPEVPGAAELRRDGCGFYGGIDRERLETVRREYLAAIENPALADRTGRSPRRLAEPGEPIYRMIINDVSQAMPAAVSLVDSGLQRFLRAYYGANFRLYSMEAWRIFHVPAEDLDGNSPYSLLWHVDGHPPDTMKLFVALDDIGEDQGPLHFVTKARSDSLVRMGYRNRHRYGGATEALEDLKYVQRLTGPVGAAAFCNTTTNLHRAGIPQPGRHRDILQFRFEAATEPFDPSAPLTAVKGRKSV